MTQFSSFKVRANTKLALQLTELAYKGVGNKHYLVDDIKERAWYISINFAHYNNPTTALCEAEGSPAKVQLLIDLEHHQNNSYVVGSFHYDYHLHKKCPVSQQPLLNSVRAILIDIANHCHPIENEYRNYPGWQTKIPDDKNGVLELPDYNS